MCVCRYLYSIEFHIIKKLINTTISDYYDIGLQNILMCD